MIAGVIKPSIFSKLFKNNVSRKKLFLIFGGATLLFFIVAIATTPNDISKQTAIPNQEKEVDSQDQTKTNETQVETQAEVPAPVKEETAPETIEQKITKVINESLGEKTNMGKTSVVEVSMRQYNAAELKAYNYNPADKVFIAFIKINSSENFTTNLQKATMNKEATKIFQKVFPLQSDIVDITLWSQLPLKDQYGNQGDDVAIIYGMARPLFDKIKWDNFYYRDLPDLLKSEGRVDDRNSYFEKIKF